MKILKGIKDGALLQRDEHGFCRCMFTAETSGRLRTSLGEIEEKGDGRYILSGIAEGGPYNVILSDDTDKTELMIRVGDLWILGGQSNMEGAGCVTEETDKEAECATENIRSYYLDGRWDKAVPVIHEPWLSDDEMIGKAWRKYRRESVWNTDVPDEYNGKKCRIRAVGPGYYFAKRMYEITKVPQAVIPCAMGGSNMEQWEKPENGEENLYAVMLRRFEECGGFVKGIFWGQGEAEAYENSNFTNKMIKFISDVRNDFNSPSLPFVQVQIAKCNTWECCNNSMMGYYWSCIKEEQRILHSRVPDLTTVSAIDADYDDLIHYSSAFQRKMGVRGANAMAHLVGNGGCPPPDIEKITVRSNVEYLPFFHIIDIYYSNTKELTAVGIPSGFMVLKKGEDVKSVYNPSCGVQKIELNENKVTIYTEVRENIEDIIIYYGYGNMTYCNIENENGYSIPAMGPIRTGDYM